MSDEFDLRDKLVCELLNGLIASGDKHDAYKELLWFLTGNHENSSRVESVIRSCYKLADIMRKVRLAAFE